MRSRDGRRFSRIAMSLAKEFSGIDPIRLRELAGLKFTAEKTQLAVIEGDTFAREDLIRLGNLIARKEGELRANASRQNDRPVSSGDA